MGHAILVRTDYTAGEARRFAQRANDAAQARRLLAIANWLSNRIFQSFDDIVDHCCHAWKTLSISRGKSCPSPAAIGQPQLTGYLRIGIIPNPND